MLSNVKRIDEKERETASRGANRLSTSARETDR